MVSFIRLFSDEFRAFTIHHFEFLCNLGRQVLVLANGQNVAKFRQVGFGSAEGYGLRFVGLGRGVCLVCNVGLPI